MTVALSQGPVSYTHLISLPGTFEDPVAPVYVDGKLATTLRGDTIVADFKQILDKYVESHYGQGAKSEELVGAH